MGSSFSTARQQASSKKHSATVVVAAAVIVGNKGGNRHGQEPPHVTALHPDAKQHSQQGSTRRDRPTRSTEKSDTTRRRRIHDTPLPSKRKKSQPTKEPPPPPSSTKTPDNLQTEREINQITRHRNPTDRTPNHIQSIKQTGEKPNRTEPNGALRRDWEVVEPHRHRQLLNAAAAAAGNRIDRTH